MDRIVNGRSLSDISSVASGAIKDFLFEDKNSSEIFSLHNGGGISAISS
jgi:hypothetical protein